MALAVPRVTHGASQRWKVAVGLCTGALHGTRQNFASDCAAGSSDGKRAGWRVACAGTGAGECIDQLAEGSD